LVWFSLTVLLLAVTAGLAEQREVGSLQLSLAEKEAFLLNAKIVNDWHLTRGIRNTRQAILDDGKMRHDAHLQTVDLSLPSYQTQRGVEQNFRDTYKYNVAAYELTKLLDLDMVPPSVERKVDRRPAAVTWWVDDKMLDEVDRVRQNIQPPDLDRWNKQIYVVRVFDQLVYNTDRNLGNLVITKNWNVWMIDHTRAFRTPKTLENPNSLVQCDRKLLVKLRELDKGALRQRLVKYLSGPEIDGILARRDKIVKFFDEEVARKGEGAVLYNLADFRQ
jgi:hypothetical protein